VLNTLSDPYTVIVVSDASIRNNINISIAYIHSFSSSTKKIFYYAIDIIMTKVELFIIRYRINQAIKISDFSCIIVITNAIYIVQRIFDFTNLYQL